MFKLRYFGVFCMLLFVLACKKDDAEYLRFSELGAAKKEYTIPATSGQFEINVLSSGNFEVVLPQDQNWLKLSSNKMKGDTSFLLDHEANAGFPRKSIVTLYAAESERYDTVLVKQNGTEQPMLNFPTLNTTVLGDGGQVAGKLKTNIPLEDIDIAVIYPSPDVEPWVNADFAYDKATEDFSFTVKPNTSQTELRNVQIRLSYKDGWDTEHVSTLYLLQANAQNMFGTQADFPEIRIWAGEKITSDLFIEGHVVSEAGNPNVGDAPQTTPTAINYTENDRTVYVQSLDGRYGFRILTSTPSDNIFKRYSKVQILLKGAGVERESNPNRYTLTGVTSMMVMKQEEGNAAQLALKQKYMGDLTDDDIYTFVTLKDVEFPIRKGSFTPVNEGYSTLFSAHRIGKYPLLMRDKNGDALFTMTNTRTLYRRDGDILPYGSGTISGIVVHEKFTRFEYQDAALEQDFGNIGRYQIRHLAKEDIKMNKEVSNGFSELLTEYQYPNIVNGIALPTWGNNGSISFSTNTVNLSRGSDYSYLGPVGASNLGNTNQYGNGVLTGAGSKFDTEATTNSDGKGGVTNAAMTANNTWWNYEKNRGEGFVVDFSTQGVNSSQLSLQFTALNLVGGTGKGAPRYWKVEWSEHGNMDGNWTKIESYTVPDAPLWANTNIHQLPAYKNINVKLPLALLGKQKVYLRLVVEKNLSSDGNSYASEPLEVATSTGIGYLAIRYNK
ncbi:BACON domain-containing protein [Sphingobacterium faecale]|uniref:BACON domain-containing protein n=1 Tax=Sphingobacterium faecale TaxID=2803775 RepID=A0ABS1R8J2_9SPHI|nr:BACON domain-containing protein [Sphingobacterium faecale]MBL1411031.1 BACON domain-containing protein [Sphingobacterium faecale]